MKTPFLLLLILVPSLISAEGSRRERTREGRVFSLFSVVSFQNSGCTSTSGNTGSGNQRNGTCYTSTECQNKGGSASGNCASGFGVCCVFIINTATTVSENCTYIQNPNFPAGDTSATGYSYTINKCSSAVCFLRLDFETFTITGPANTLDDGICVSDTFSVTTNTGQPIPVICGTNTGQHMYIDIGANAGDSATLDFAFTGTTSSRTWEIKVTQVECSNPASPPAGCLQYHVGLTGRMTTFNYDTTATGQHLENQQYSTCIRAEAGYCCIQYQVCPDQIGVVPQVANMISPGFSLGNIANMAIATQDDECLTNTLDYIGISTSDTSCQQGTSTPVTTTTRYCGGKFNAFNSIFNVPICDCTAPFSIDVFTDALTDDNANVQNQLQSIGVCLEWTQIPCSN